jgi:hypothetical protein
MSTFTRETARWARTLHIYISLVGFLMFGFFAVTGILLNHDSFGFDQTNSTQKKISLPVEIARVGDQAAVAAALQDALGMRLSVTQYNARPDEIDATMAGPGQRAQVAIHRQDGAAEVTLESRGMAGRLADLHKGAESGGVWRAVLDAVSVLLAVSSLTGLIIVMSLPRRRKWGLFAASAGTVAAGLAYLIWVPK